MATHNGDVRVKTENIIFSGIVLAVFEGLGLCCSDSAGAFSGWSLAVVHWLAYCCYVAGPFGVWYEMSNGSFAKKFKRILLWYLLVCVLAAAFAFFIWRPEPLPKLHLTLFVHTMDAPDEDLHFTNSFLFLKTINGSFNFPANMPFLAVDVARNEPQITLKFGIINDSAPPFSPSEFDIEKPEIRIWIVNPDPGESLKWNADSKWEKASGSGTLTNGMETNFPGQVLRYQFPDSLAAGVGNTAPGITFNMQEKPGKLTVAMLVGGKNVTPTMFCFDLLAVPSEETVSKMYFDTNSMIWWGWKYRPVEYRPIDTPIVISPTNRVQLSDGNNLFGSRVDISNPSSNNLYAITFSIEMENGTVPLNSAEVNLSQSKQHEINDNGDLQIPFEASMDFIGTSQGRLFIIPELDANEHRTIWIRGTIITNSFADISVWQSLNSFPNVPYGTNGMWDWPVLSSNSAWWIHIGGQPMNLGFGIMAWRGNATNGFTNDSQIIPSRP